VDDQVSIARALSGSWVQHHVDQALELFRKVELTISSPISLLVCAEQLIQFIGANRSLAAWDSIKTIKGVACSDHAEEHNTEGIDIDRLSGVFAALKNFWSHIARCSQV